MARINIFLALLFAIVTGGVGSAASAQQASQATPTGVAYRINPGDELAVLAWGDERLQRSVRVLPDGTFAFPLVGQVVAAGRLPSELERIIARGLQTQYRGQGARGAGRGENPL